MSQINVLALFRAKTQHRDELKQRLSALAEAVHAEPGCLLYSLQQGTDDPDVFAYVEVGLRGGTGCTREGTAHARGRR